jgi:hypothetical protein
MRMSTTKYLTLTLIIIIIFAVFTACANTRSIEDTISQFESAANNQNFGSFKDTLSEDSQFWITGDPAIQSFLVDYLGTFIPIVFSGLSINEIGNDATVNANATYNSISQSVMFVMKKHDEVWKVKEYWDDSTGSMEFVWLKIKDTILLEE